MGVAQTFAGVARVTAPIVGTVAFQRISHASPFYLAAVIVAVVGLMALRVEPMPQHTAETPVPVPATPKGGTLPSG